MNLIVWAPLAGACILAGLGLLPRSEPLRKWSGVGVSFLILATGFLLIAADGHTGSAVTSGGGILRADSLSAYMLAVIGAVALVATWGGVAIGRAPVNSDRSYAAFICVFLGAMSLAVLADNIGVMWIAVEATTIATAFLVGHHRTRRSLEAAWKYVILGSVGVAIAFLGIVLIYASSATAATPTLSWLALGHLGPKLDPGLVRLGGALAVLGFATKAGLAPMHSWLPDAHSQAPAPVSGLMSGVLLSVALYAIMRIQSVVDGAVGPEFLRILLIGLGLLSLAVAAALLLRQRDYKRMLAYSSIEHMGVMAIGVAIGPAALPAVLFYILSHGLIKACLFVLSGRILAVEGTSVVSDVRALLVRRPGLAIPWLIGIVALLGFPPFGIFFAEVGIIFAGWESGQGVVVAIALVLLLLIFAALTRVTIAMVFGANNAKAAGSASRAVSDHSPHGRRAPIVLAIVFVTIVPFLSGTLGASLVRAAAVLGHSQ
jgi:hydrogenase-4 component F